MTDSSPAFSQPNGSSVQESLRSLRIQLQKARQQQTKYKLQLNTLNSTRQKISSSIEQLSAGYNKQLKSLEQKIKKLETQNKQLQKKNELYEMEVRNFEQRLLQKDKIIAGMLSKELNFFAGQKKGLIAVNEVFSPRDQQAKKIEQYGESENIRIQQSKGSKGIQTIDRIQDKKNKNRQKQTPKQTEVINSSQNHFTYEAEQINELIAPPSRHTKKRQFKKLAKVIPTQFIEPKLMQPVKQPVQQQYRPSDYIEEVENKNEILIESNQVPQCTQQPQIQVHESLNNQQSNLNENNYQFQQVVMKDDNFEAQTQHLSQNPFQPNYVQNQKDEEPQKQQQNEVQQKQQKGVVDQLHQAQTEIQFNHEFETQQISTNEINDTFKNYVVDQYCKQPENEHLKSQQIKSPEKLQQQSQFSKQQSETTQLPHQKIQKAKQVQIEHVQREHQKVDVEEQIQQPQVVMPVKRSTPPPPPVKKPPMAPGVSKGSKPRHGPPKNIKRYVAHSSFDEEQPKNQVNLFTSVNEQAEKPQQTNILNEMTDITGFHQNQSHEHHKLNIRQVVSKEELTPRVEQVSKISQDIKNKNTQLLKESQNSGSSKEHQNESHNLSQGSITRSKRGKRQPPKIIRPEVIQFHDQGNFSQENPTQYETPLRNYEHLQPTANFFETLANDGQNDVQTYQQDNNFISSYGHRDDHEMHVDQSSIQQIEDTSMISNPIFPQDSDYGVQRGNFDNFVGDAVNETKQVKKAVMPPPPSSKKMSKRKGKREAIGTIDPQIF